MNRQQKESSISDFVKILTDSQSTILVKYKGLSVNNMQSLRQNLREDGGNLKITKARLMKIAAQQVGSSVQGLSEFKEHFHDQVGLVFSKEDNISALAKRLVNFSKDNQTFELVAGLYEQRLLSVNELKTYASLPSRDVLLAILAGTLKEPIAQFARALNLIAESRKENI